MYELAQAIAILSAALFGGAALYISLAEHPARLECGTELASTVFPPSYRRAAAMQVTLTGIDRTVCGDLRGRKARPQVGRRRDPPPAVTRFHPAMRAGGGNSCELYGSSPC